MPHFAVSLAPGPGWDPALARREQPGWDQHAAYMDSLVDEGVVLIGGPVGGFDRVLLAVEASSEVEVIERMAADPWAPRGVLRVASVLPWSLWLRAEG